MKATRVRERVSDIATPKLRLAHRLSQVTIGATLVLILAGGLVTNTGSALAVPDWPTTFGYNMFLYPWAKMVGGIFFEHSHRLIGTLVGLLTLGLAASLWPAGGRWRALGVAAAAAVVLQGVLGGLRVVLLDHTLAIVHGCVAQAFVALLAAISALTAPERDTLAEREIDPRLKTLTLAAAATVYAQLVFGALATHAGWIHLHLLGALAVYGLLPVVTARLRRWHGANAGLTRFVLVMLAVQLALGIASYLVRFTSLSIPGAPTTTLLMPVAHRVAGSVILAATIVLTVRATLAQGGRQEAVTRPLVSEAAS